MERWFLGSVSDGFVVGWVVKKNSDHCSHLIQYFLLFFFLLDHELQPIFFNIKATQRNKKLSEHGVASHFSGDGKSHRLEHSGRHIAERTIFAPKFKLLGGHHKGHYEDKKRNQGLGIGGCFVFCFCFCFCYFCYLF